MHIYYNDEITQTACLQPTSPGFQFGYGLFETILIRQGHPCFLDLHYQRLVRGCSKLGLNLSLDLETLYSQAIKLSETNKITEGRLKLICFRDTNRDSTMMTLMDYKLEASYLQKGISLGISSINRNPHSPLCYLKSLNYAENIMAKEEARGLGYEEALFLNVDNKLCEGAVSNIFWVKSNVIYTPEASCGLLEGITRGQVIELCDIAGIRLMQGSYDLEELLQAEEIFVTNALMGIISVCRVDDTPFDITDNNITRLLRNEYEKLVGQQLQLSL